MLCCSEPHRTRVVNHAMLQRAAPDARSELRAVGAGRYAAEDAHRSGATVEHDRLLQLSQAAAARRRSRDVADERTRHAEWR